MQCRVIVWHWIWKVDVIAGDAMRYVQFQLVVLLFLIYNCFINRSFSFCFLIPFLANVMYLEGAAWPWRYNPTRQALSSFGIVQVNCYFILPSHSIGC